MVVVGIRLMLLKVIGREVYLWARGPRLSEDLGLKRCPNI